MKKIPMLEKFAAQSLVESDGELIFSKEKFAELIVRECIDWCNAHARDDGTAQRIAEDIKKDFGVELRTFEQGDKNE